MVWRMVPYLLAQASTVMLAAELSQTLHGTTATVVILVVTVLATNLLTLGGFLQQVYLRGIWRERMALVASLVEAVRRDMSPIEWFDAQVERHCAEAIATGLLTPEQVADILHLGDQE